MQTTFKDLTDFLRELGIVELPHSGKSYLAHLVGVYRDLESWGAPEDVCRAGMFHSIYGTEIFQGFTLPQDRRGDVQKLIGTRAEWLAYVNCVMDRATFDGALTQLEGPYRLADRQGQTLELTTADYDDLCRVHLCDWLEQVERSQSWDYRRDAYRKMAERLGGVALAAHERVFAAASPA